MNKDPESTALDIQPTASELTKKRKDATAPPKIKKPTKKRLLKRTARLTQLKLEIDFLNLI